MNHEWESEPDHLEWRDADTGLPCIINRNGFGAWCGYVGVPPGHPMHRKPYDPDLCAVDVHGGLTYAEPCQGEICHTPQPGESDDVWWLGFDCSHAGDFNPTQRGNLGRHETYRNMAFVQGEVRSLARQLAAMTA